MKCLDKMFVDEMSLDTATTYCLLFTQINIYEMSVNKMSVDKMSLNDMYEDKIFVDQKSNGLN
jgi:hypothetical protein